VAIAAPQLLDQVVPVNRLSPSTSAVGAGLHGVLDSHDPGAAAGEDKALAAHGVLVGVKYCPNLACISAEALLSKALKIMLFLHKVSACSVWGLVLIAWLSRA
jgi:hypothetical protein